MGGYNNYSINTFFWFFESRKDPANAPLSIWFNGGPGASSLLGALQENGPCRINDDSNSTSLNPWSFNNEVNMLYIDQPNQVGFSWDILTNGTLDVVQNVIQPQDFSHGIPEQNNTFYVGTFPSQNPSNTANDTQNAAKALWIFAQTWFQEFPGNIPSTIHSFADLIDPMQITNPTMTQYQSSLSHMVDIMDPFLPLSSKSKIWPLPMDRSKRLETHTSFISTPLASLMAASTY